jgi:hypothetical protein
MICTIDRGNQGTTAWSAPGQPMVGAIVPLGRRRPALAPPPRAVPVEARPPAAVLQTGSHPAPATRSRAEREVCAGHPLRNRSVDEHRRDALGGSLWRSQGGSLYLFAGSSFTCIAVHAAWFRGWVGSVAVRVVSRVGSTATGLQAFRHGPSGALAAWAPVALRFEAGVITKTFPADPPGALVYGPVERYYRVSCTGL